MFSSLDVSTTHMALEQNNRDAHAGGVGVHELPPIRVLLAVPIAQQVDDVLFRLMICA